MQFFVGNFDVKSLDDDDDDTPLFDRIQVRLPFGRTTHVCAVFARVTMTLTR